MKNPWMSAWLSAANKAAGPLRGAAMAEAARHRKALLDRWSKVWTGGAASAPKQAVKPARKRPTRKK